MRQIENRPIGGAINRAERIGWEKDIRSTLLWKQFREVGFMWFGTEVDKSTGRSYGHNLIPVEQKKERYIQTLTTLKNKSEHRIQLLRALASGMRLTENNAYPAVDAKYEKRFRFVPLGYSGDNPLGVSFTISSRHFIEALGDMSGHSRKQQEKFREFMIRDAGLKGRVGLPQLFPGISRWLDHAK